ncbi:hypothetical protein MTR67_017776 [Solanum verrucosum]|uniref:Uncharacterized protein n=1 Tax=Solanum verrucosum TaxID=315347 RepID=A0AAF0QJH3_SOLVR|nr:hypothetical protein MTR67_017776 [Solanum verrucosum]
MVDFDIILGMDWLHSCPKGELVVDVAHVEEKGKELAKDVHRLARLGVSLIDTSDGGVIVQNRSQEWIGYIHVMPQSIVELGSFGFSFQRAGV